MSSLYNLLIGRKQRTTWGNFMKPLRLIATLSILTLLFGCDNNKDRNRQNEIKRIVFATGGCFGACPIQVIDIDSSLIAKYHGVKYTDSTGFYLGNITSGFWDSININFEKINYKHLDSSYEKSVDDLSTEIFIFYNNNNLKHIFAQSSSLPDSVLKTYEWLTGTIKQMKFIRTNDSLTFPTKIEKPLPIPPFPTTVKFLTQPIGGN